MTQGFCIYFEPFFGFFLFFIIITATSRPFLGCWVALWMVPWHRCYSFVSRRRLLALRSIAENWGEKRGIESLGGNNLFSPNRVLAMLSSARSLAATGIWVALLLCTNQSATQHLETGLEVANMIIKTERQLTKSSTFISQILTVGHKGLISRKKAKMYRI